MRDICNSRVDQLSAGANASNARDTRQFSHAYLRRLRADVLLDSVVAVTGVPRRFDGFPEGTRAIEYYPRESGSTEGPHFGEPFFATFGRSSRATICARETRREPTLSQTLHMAVGDVKTSRPFPVLALAASPRAPLAAVGSYECVDFIDPATRRVLGSLPFAQGEPHVLRFSRSGALLLAAGGRPVQNGAAVLFDVKSGKRLAELGNEPDVVIAADISGDERRVALGGPGRVVKVFSTETGTLLHTLVKHTDWITAAAFSPDGRLLATGDRIGNIHLWDARRGGVVLPLAEHKGAVRALAWRSDSRVLASCGEDGLLVWWDVARGWPSMSRADAHPPHRPAGYHGKIANGILDAAFGPKGELVSCGRDRNVRLWGDDGGELKRFSLDAGDAGSASPAGVRVLPTRVAITFDGSAILAGDSSGQIHAWPVETRKAR